MSSFFRGTHYFEYLTDVFIPLWIKKNPRRKLKILSAGCARGQEPYTLAILISQKFKNLQFEVTGVDLHKNLLIAAEAGFYSRKEIVRRVPKPYVKKYFSPIPGVSRSWIQVKPQIRAKVQFTWGNLVKGPLPRSGPYDLIVCRHVLTHLDAAAIAKVAKNLYAISRADAELLTVPKECTPKMLRPWNEKKSGFYYRSHRMMK